MRISAINNTNHQSNANHLQKNPNFNGIFKQKYSSNSSYEYNGIPSGSSGDGYYTGYNSSSAYVYHPFKNESEAEIEKVLKENNYCIFYDPESTGGFGGEDSRDTVRGRTIPYTEREWNKLSKREQDRITELL